MVESYHMEIASRNLGDIEDCSMCIVSGDDTHREDKAITGSTQESGLKYFSI